MKYSQVFIDHGFRVDLLVDNATTHTKALVDISMFAKSANRACPITEINWLDENGNENRTDCYFKSGSLKGQSKGLYNLCRELKIIDSSISYQKISLPELREKAIMHPAFNHISILEHFITDFNKKNNMDIKLVHVPKFHCELNPIEMYWARLKFHFRKYNKQSTNEIEVVNLILEARKDYTQSDVNLRLFSRFWRIIEAYYDNKSYAEVMKTFFNAGTELKSHRKIKKRDDN